MHALCFLPPVAIARLRQALPPPHRIRSATTWDDLIDHAVHRRDDVVVVDPCAERESEAMRRVSALGAALAHADPPPLVAYVAVTAAAIHCAHALAQLGASEVVVRGVDDRADALAAALRRAAVRSSAQRLIDTVCEPIARVPGNVAEALRLAFRSPERVRSVCDVARAAGITRRSLDRWLARAGLAPGRTLLACARANAAFNLIAAGHVAPRHAAVMLGYSSARGLGRELRVLTGHTPTLLRRHGVTGREFEAALGARLLRRETSARLARAS